MSTSSSKPTPKLTVPKPSRRPTPTPTNGSGQEPGPSPESPDVAPSQATPEPTTAAAPPREDAPTTPTRHVGAMEPATPQAGSTSGSLEHRAPDAPPAWAQAAQAAWAGPPQGDRHSAGPSVPIMPPPPPMQFEVRRTTAVLGLRVDEETLVWWKRNTGIATAALQIPDGLLPRVAAEYLCHALPEIVKECERRLGRQP